MPGLDPKIVGLEMQVAASSGASLLLYGLLRGRCEYLDPFEIGTCVWNLVGYFIHDLHKRVVRAEPGDEDEECPYCIIEEAIYGTFMYMLVVPDKDDDQEAKH